MVERKAKNQFPRKADLPSQSAKYWAKEKDRYLRQLLIADIEEETGRELVVYFSRLDQQITETDADDLSEILDGVEDREVDGRKTKQIDLMIHTLGGYVDAVEKFNGVLQFSSADYRVIIPSFAKSGGTLIALSGRKILMGVNSDLGPIDPQIAIPDLGVVPAQYVAEDESQPQTYQKIAKAMFDRARNLATKYLSSGMMEKSTPEEIDRAVNKLSNATEYGSHGAVIDYAEASKLGLSVEWMQPDSTLWRRLWLLHCLYDADTKRDDLGKIFEGGAYSLSRKPSS
jgi:ClpP class serine protease